VRLDAELVRRGLARSREQAGELVAAGRVTVAGLRAAKAATQVTRDAPISIADTGEPGYVSRGGRKLAGALAVFGSGGLTVAGRAGQLGLGVRGITASPLPGPAGNVEYFLWLRRGAPPLDDSQLERAIKEGPS